MWQNKTNAFNGGDEALILKRTRMKYNTVVGIAKIVMHRSHPKICPQHFLHSSV